jgi:hypothetical protein
MNPSPAKGHALYRIAAVLVGAGGAYSVAWALMHRAPEEWNRYGYLLFLGVPTMVGIVVTVIAGLGGPVRFWPELGWSVLALVLFALGLLATGEEGAICLLMAIPPAALPLALGVWIGLGILNRLPSMYGLLVALGLGGTFDLVRGGETVSEARTAVEVNAPPERVWREVVALDQLPPPTDPLLCTGIACPVRTELRGTGVGAARHCTLTTGAMPERIVAWDPGRRLAFVALETPPMMREVNPFRKSEPPHLRGHYRVLRGEFILEPLPGNRTRLWRTTRYAHRFGPAFYWTAWCDLGADRAHRYVLGVVKERAERARMAARP